MTTKWNPRIKTRLIVLFYMMLSCFMLLGVRLVRVQAMDRVDLQNKALDEHIGSTAVPALRGSIIDCHGQLLATSLSLPSVAANPRAVADASATAYALSDLLHMTPSETYRLLASPGTFVWVKRKIPLALAHKVEDMKLPGVFLLHEASGRRFYPKGSLASHIVGYCGIDDNGLEGLESRFDSILKGKDGLLEAEMDRDGTMIPEGWSHLTPAKPGNSLVLTIDETLQYVVERELARAIHEHKAESGSAIVMEVRTGDILAMANYPTYDNRHYSTAAASSRRNRAVTDNYEPGSTCKVFLAAGALDSGKINLTQTFYSADSINVGGWTLHNAESGEGAPSGMATIIDIITHSYNTGAASVALFIGRMTYRHYLTRFGFGQVTGIQYPGEERGDIPPLKAWQPITTATIAFGQGATVTPLQVVRAMAAIANKGTMMTPRLVKDILGPDGEVVKSYPPVVAGHPIRPETAATMTNILRNVVVNGTGTNAEVKGYPVCGKTGTASVAHNGAYGPGHYIGSFLGFLPMQDPRVVILVKVDEPTTGGYYGGAVAAPAWHRIARTTMRHLGIAPVAVVEKPLKKGELPPKDVDEEDEDPSPSPSPAPPAATPHSTPHR